MINPLPRSVWRIDSLSGKTLPGEKLLAVVARESTTNVSPSHLPIEYPMSRVPDRRIISPVHPDFAPIIVILKVL